MERNKAVPASYLVLRRNGKILLTRRQGSGYYDGWYGLPAGHIEAGELPTECLIREAKEEIGVDIQKENVTLAHTMYRTKNDATGDRADYFFVVDTWNGKPKIMEPEKCDGMDWFSLDALPKNTVHHTKIALEHIAAGTNHSELGRDDVHKNPNERSV